MNRNTFLFGSGFSNDLANLPTLTELSSGVIKYINDIQSIGPRHAALKQILEDTPKAAQANIEYLLTLLRGDNQWLDRADSALRNGAFRSLSHAVREVIKEAQNAERYNDGAMAAFEKIVAHWQENDSRVVTFNYDVLIEKIASDQLSTKERRADAGEFYSGPFQYLGNRTESTLARSQERFFKVVKLHGSVNWYYSGNSDFSGEPIYFDPLLPDKHPATALVEDNRVDLEELIIPPLLDKDSFTDHPLVRYQWKEALHYFATATNIFVLGYSLPATDLAAKFLLMEANVHARKATWHVLVHNSAGIEIEKRFAEVISKDRLKFHSVNKNESSIETLWKLIGSEPNGEV